MSSDVFDVVIRGETRELAASVSTARTALGSLRSVVSSTGSVLRAFGLEHTAAGRAVDSATVAVYAATAALQGYRAAIATTKLAILPLIGNFVVFAAVATAVALALDQITQRLGRLGDFIGRVLRAFGPAAPLLELLRSRASAAVENIDEAIDALVRMNLFDRQQAEEAARGQQARFLAESARIEQARREAVAAAKATAAERKRQAEEAAKAVEAAFQLEADAIAAFNIWQREQWEQAAQARTKIFLEEAERRKQEELRIERETVDLIVLANQQAIERIEQEERERLDETRRILDEIVQLERETADLITTANRQAMDEIDRQERERIDEAKRLLEEERRAREEALRPWIELRDRVIDAFADIITGAKNAVDVLRTIVNDVIRMLIRYLVRLALPFLFGEGAALPGRSIVTAQAGAVFTRPTLAAIAERPGMTELALPLPPGLRPEALAAAIQGGRQPISLHLQLAVVFDPSQIPPPPPEYVQAVIVADISRRGPTMQAIRMAMA